MLAIVVTYAWVITFLPKLVVKVNARIYSTENNIGVLNEEGIFDIAIENHDNSTRTINIVIDADEHILYNVTVVIEPISSKNLTINQKLIFLGLWTIRFFEDEKMVGGYSFITVVNKSEADFRITQLDNMNLNRILSIGAVVISILILIVNVVQVRYSRKQYVRKSKTKGQKRESYKQEPKKETLTETRVHLKMEYLIDGVFAVRSRFFPHLPHV